MATKTIINVYSLNPQVCDESRACHFEDIFGYVFNIPIFMNTTTAVTCHEPIGVYLKTL